MMAANHEPEGQNMADEEEGEEFDLGISLEVVATVVDLAHAVQEALDEGELETGCTVHLVTVEIDAGRILAQTKVPILVGDDAETLHARIKKAEHKLLPKVLSEWKR